MADSGYALGASKQKAIAKLEAKFGLRGGAALEIGGPGIISLPDSYSASEALLGERVSRAPPMVHIKELPNFDRRGSLRKK